ncbi:MAG TPA: penicillin-binding protein 2 [Polyangiaceae bacterium]|nr:penicillin-binding protein 2 [Polyangiaceae bacterium]
MSFLGQRSDVGEFRRRFRYHAAFVLLVFAVVLGRLFFLQVVLGDEYGAAARENVVRRVTLATTRGVVRDAQGKVLASNRPSYNVYAVPQQFEGRRPVCVTKTDAWAKAVDYLRLGAEERARIEKRLDDLCGEPGVDPKARKFQQLLVREDVGRDAVAALETHEAELKGIDVVPVPVRYYPYGELAAHTLGYMAEIDREGLVRLRPSGYIEGDRIGAAGVERGWESYLRGSRGWEKTLVDARGTRRAAAQQAERLIDEPRRLDPVPGRDLRLTLDVELIEAVDRAMRGQIAGAAVAVDVRTGRVLALYSKPSFDPNVLSGGFGVQAIRDAFRRLYADPLKPTLDKTVSGSYPPGSTYKPFSALAALEEKLLDPRAEVDCRGFIVYGKRVFRCTHVHGRVNMREAIARSCNIYFYQLGDAIGLDRLARMGIEYGFGQKTGLGVNPEAPGRIPTRSWYATHYKGQYHGGFTLNAAIGQGATTVSVLQLALAYAALANGGTLYQPQIVRAVETSDGAVVQDFPPRVKKRIQLRPENWQLVTNAMWEVVNDKEGTAYAERLSDVDMAGKTGTAQTSHRRVANEDPGRTWYFNRDHAWFAGYAPSKAPEIAVAVLIEHGGVGGKNAAPVAFAAAREFQRLQQARLSPKAAAGPGQRPQRTGGAAPPRPNPQPRGD